VRQKLKEREALAFWLDRVKLRLTSALAAHNIPFAFEPGGEIHYRYAVLSGVQQPGITVERIDRLSETLAQAADVATVTVGRRGWRITMTLPLPREFCRIVAFPETLPASRSLTALLGRAEDGAWRVLDLTSPDTPHVLIAGSTGSGKTVLARTMAASLALGNPMGHVSLVLVDPAGHNYDHLAALPHVRMAALTVPLGVAALRWLEAELDRRQADPTLRRPRLVVFVDELAELALVGGQDVERAMTRIVQLGRQFGIHAVACTQKPTAAVIGSLVKANFPVRVVGSVPSPEDAKVAAGLAGTGAERLTGRGDMLLVARGKVTRFQAAYLSDDRLAAIIRQVGGEGHKVHLAQLAPFLEDPGGGDGTGLTDERIRELWASGEYRSRRALEIALFGYAGGQASTRVARALGATTTTPGRDGNDGQRGGLVAAS